MSSKMSMVNVEAATTLNSIIDEYISEFHMMPRKKEIGIPKSTKERKAEQMMAASSIDELEYETVREAVSKTVSVMREIEYEIVTHDLSEYKDRRRKVEEILSILHVGRAYPDKAIKRLKSLRPKLAKL
jgi:hypothetical protein